MSLPFLLPFCVFLSLFALIDAQIAARDVPPPQTLDIPVSLHSSQVYSVKVNMSSNASPQSFSFALSTSTAITTVAGTDCDSCGGVPSYNPSASSSVQQLPQAQNVSTLNGTASGAVVREYCGLLQSNGSAWVYPNQTVTVANQSATFFSPGVSGMIGMGLAPFVDSPAANWLAQNPTQPTFSFGMALNPPSNFSTDGGVLHWLHPDSSFYRGDIAWKPMLAANASMPSNLSSWFVEMDAWSVSGSSSSFNISQSGTELLTLLDPFYSNIVFPQTFARAIYADIPGASKHATSAFAHSWKLPCNSKFRLTVTFGTFSTSLDQTSLVVKQADGVCVGALQEWIDASATEYLLGSPFIAVLYLIFSYSQQGDGSVGVAARITASNKLSTGALVGIILGTVAVAALLIIAGVLLYFAFLRRSAKAAHERKFSKPETPFADVTPFTDFTDSTASPRSLRPNNPDGQQQDEPWSPGWQTTLLTDGTPSPNPNTNSFPVGTTYESHSSHAYYRTEVDSSGSLDSPPPYAIPPGTPVPLLPVRKNRQPS